LKENELKENKVIWLSSSKLLRVQGYQNILFLECCQKKYDKEIEG
jgi:hypothetical protein